MNIESPDQNDLNKIAEQYKAWEPFLNNHQQAPYPESYRSFEIFRQDLQEMSLLVDISQPPNFESHRKSIGRLVVIAKQTLAKLASPFIRILFWRQIRMNQLIHAMAFRVAALEHRVQELEAQRGMDYHGQK